MPAAEDDEWGDLLGLQQDTLADEEEEEAAMLRALQEEEELRELREKYGFEPKRRKGKCFTCGEEGHFSPECPRNPRAHAWKAPGGKLPTDPARLAAAQRPDPQPWPAAPGLVPLLRRCLEASAASLGPRSGYQAYLCCPVQHFSAQYGDRGWGCGWRNIQMLSSALLRRFPSHRNALFSGLGQVPGIAALQAWLETAWVAGFDTVGCESLGGQIQGDRKWIGTTEAAALLRYFGLQGHIVDFVGHGPNAGGASDASMAPTPSYRMVSMDTLTSGGGGGSGGPGGADGGGGWQAKTSAAQGLMVPVHDGVECDGCGQCPVVGVRYQSLSRSNYDLCSACAAQSAAQSAAPFQQIPTEQELAAATSSSASASGSGSRAGFGSGSGGSGDPPSPQHLHGPLVDWVWAYFSGKHAPTCHMHACNSNGGANGGGSSSMAHPCQHQSNSISGNGSSGNGSGSGNCGNGDNGNGPRSGFNHGSSSLSPSRAGAPPRGRNAFDVLMSASRDAVTTTTTATANHNNSRTDGFGPAAVSLGSGSGSVVLTGMPPLYFQHEGHSRTIIGIERRLVALPKGGGTQEVMTLLVLDPGVSATTFDRDLRSGKQWQRHVRRGVHTLTRPQYQLMYVLDELADPNTREELKVIKASEVVRPSAAGS